MRSYIGLFFVSFVLSACSGDSTEKIIHSTSASTEASAIPTGALVISGSVVNGEDAANTSALQNQDVEVIRNDGVIVASGQTDADANFTVDVAAGALMIDSSFSAVTGLTADGEQATSDDFTYMLQVKVPDDGAGRALGLRRKIEISEDTISTDGKLDLGSNSMKEVTAIIGNLAFADAQVSLSGADIFIPGQPYFVRTGDDGSFSLLFVPAGSYTIRITKGYYIKDVTVNVTAGETTDLETVTVQSDERNPLPLATVLPGTWQSKCYYDDIMGSGVSPENPRSGTVTVTSLTQVAVTNDSCLLRTFAAADNFGNFNKLLLLGDGAIVLKLTSYYMSYITSYTNDQIVFDVDNRSMGSSRMIEVWTRVN